LIRAVAVDIDGTITDQHRVLDPLALKAISRIEVPVVLASGNTHCFTRATAFLTGASLSFVAENGGVVSYAGDDVDCLADISICEDAYEHLRKVFHVETLDSRYRITDLALRNNFNATEASQHLDDLGLPVELLDTGFAIHIKDKQVNKGLALRRIMKHLGIADSDFAAVGDGLGDIPMFREVGFGAAVGNASPELKEIADYVAASVYGKGFAEIVDYMIDQNMF
jgi:phosphoglycolate phosphatase (TIGR01487 family)